MPSFAPLIIVVEHTPTWVWGLLAALLALGWAQARPRRVAAWRAALLPAAMLVWSLTGAVSSFGAGAALAAWAPGLAAATLASASLGAPAGVRWHVDARAFELPGSWVPMLLILAIFCVKFAIGASLAQHPGLRGDALFALGACLTLGTLSGVFAGRAVALLRITAQRGKRL